MFLTYWYFRNKKIYFKLNIISRRKKAFELKFKRFTFLSEQEQERCFKIPKVYRYMTVKKNLDKCLGRVKANC